MAENTNSIPADIEDALIEADGEVRQKYTGKPAKAIFPVAKEAFAKIGLILPDAELRAYANAVSLNASHEFELDG